MAKLLLAAIGLILIIAGCSALLVGSARYRTLRLVLDRSWWVERYIYRHHLAFGAAIIAGALAFLALLARYHGVGGEITHWPAFRGAQLMLLGRLAAWLFAALALVIGVIVVVRPSVLKTIEAISNRWVEPSPTALLPPRLLGILLLAAGIACLLLGEWLAPA